MSVAGVKTVFLICFSIIIAMILAILPLPDWSVWLRPEWVLLVLIFWALVMPNRVGVTTAWVVGLLVDVLEGSLMGEHALAYVIVAYFIAKFQNRIQMYSVWQQTIVIFFLILLYQGILFWIQGLVGQLPGTYRYWIPALTSIVLWPWIYALLRKSQQRFGAVAQDQDSGLGAQGSGIR